MVRGFLQAFLAVRNRPHLAGQADFAERDGFVRQCTVAKTRQHREQHRQVGRGFLHPYPAHDIDEHILVALGAAIFVAVPTQLGMGPDGLSRVIQGIATGIGFLGGGVILKLASERKIEGLTTAADIWTTATIGVAIGLGALGIGLIATAFAWVVLSVLYRVEVRRKNPR